MYKSPDALKRILQNIPEWMDTRKRTENSNSGKYLASIADEQDNIYADFEEFKKSFFLVHYLGKENETIHNVKIASVGDIDINNVTLVNIKAELTDDPKSFLKSSANRILYQDGFFIMDTNLTDQEFVRYQVGDSVYGAKINDRNLWNIFDEFAMFASLKRFKNETNAELVKRCFHVFKERPNSTNDGLKNIIINTMLNYSLLTHDNIKIETPDGHNVYIPKGDNLIYDILSDKNQDILRSKIWDESLFCNSFKTMSYLPNKWDAPMRFVQKGTGQKEDLFVKLSRDLAEEDSTDLKIKPYVASKILINSYIKRQGIKHAIPLELTKYSNELVPQRASYKILAQKAIKLDADNIYLKSMQAVTGRNKLFLSDIMEDSNIAEIIDHSKPGAGDYFMKFVAPSEDEEIQVSKANVVSGDSTTSLLKTKDGFVVKNNTLTREDASLKVCKLQHLHSYKNIKEVASGLTIGKKSSVANLAIDVTNYRGKKVDVKITCPMLNYTSDKAYVKYEGFELIGDSILKSKENENLSSIVIEMECNDFSFTFDKTEDPSKQGTVIVQYEVDGHIDTNISGIWTQDKQLSVSYKKLSSIKVRITKAGAYPVSISNIKASRYDVRYFLDDEELLFLNKEIAIPAKSKNKQSILRMMVISYSNYAPIINHIKIGSIKNIGYVTDIFTLKSTDKLDIDTNARIMLYQIKNGATSLVNPSYDTKITYRNNTERIIPMTVDTSVFNKINQASVNIVETVHNGKKTAFIELMPHQDLKEIYIEGEILQTKERRPISVLLKENVDDEVYACAGLEGFIVKSKNGTQKLKAIDRKNVAFDSNNYTIDGIPENVMPVFVIDKLKDVRAEGKTHDRSFEYLYLKVLDDNVHVSYNEHNVVAIPAEISITNNFYPFLQTSDLMTYVIEDDLSPDNHLSVFFQHGGGEKHKWILGYPAKKMLIDHDQDKKKPEDYRKEKETLSETFLLASSMPLNKTYVKEGREIELGRYVIKPPDNLSVKYKEETVIENILPEADGFNKLYYSNIAEINSIAKRNGTPLDPSEYDCVNDAGIIIWKNKDHVGEQLKISYKYLMPAALVYNNINDLYEVTNNSIDGYQSMTLSPMIVKQVTDGHVEEVYVNGIAPDKIVVECSNENYRANITKNKIVVRKVSDKNIVLAHSGFYYDRNKEHYMFQDIHRDIEKKYHNMDINNFDQRFGTFIGHQNSKNFVKDSTFIRESRVAPVCDIECTRDKDRIQGVSNLNSITSCDTYHMWRLFNMNCTLVKGKNDLAIKFGSEHNSAYGALDITDAVKDGYTLSLLASAGLKLYIMEEITPRDDHFVKSVFADKIAEIPETKNSQYRKYIFQNVDKHKRYYLVVKGNGVIDDIIVRKETEAVKNEDIYDRTITKLGFDIQEVSPNKTTEVFQFDTKNNDIKRLEISKSGKIIVGSTIDWGLTKIYDFKPDFEKFTLENISLVKDAFYTKSKRGKIISNPIALTKKKSLGAIYIKINDILLEETKYFNIYVYTGDGKYSRFKEVARAKKTNIIEIDADNLSNYIQVAVEIDTGKVISNIELYARYTEKPNESLAISQHSNGELTTKIYSLENAKNIKPLRLTGEINMPHAITFSVRGYRANNDHQIWTQWYDYKLDTDLNLVGSHVFEDYKYLQFRIGVRSSEAIINLREIILEVTYEHFSRYK